MSIDPSEYDLAQRARRGDREALAELVERTRLHLFALAYAELRHYEDAQDAVASALLQIVRHVHELREPERVRGWMQSIVRNEARRLRRESAPQPLEERDGSRDLVAPSLLRLDIERALRRLPGDQERAIRLFYLADLSIRDIARRLGRSEGTIKSWLHRGRRHLALQMEGYAPMSTTMVPTQTAAIVHSNLDLDLTQELADALGACGYDTEVITPDDLAGLPEQLRKYPLIILDEWILGHTVFELLIHLKAYPECQWTPICLLCSNPTDFAIGAYYGAGVSRIIDKKRSRSPGELEEAFRRIHLSWGRFTRQASSVAYFLVQEEALRLGSPTADPEHLLLALTRLEDSVAVQVLERLGVTPAAVREAVEAEAAKGQARAGEMMQFSEAAQEVLDKASEQARALGHSYIGSEHLLLGLIGDAHTVPGRVLAKLGITEERARETVRAGGFRILERPGLHTRIQPEEELYDTPPEGLPIPETLPLIAIRDKVYFPNMVFPLFVGRPKSVAALQEARRHGRVLFLTAQKEMSVDDPQEGDLYPTGVVAHLLQLLQLPDQSVRVLVQGLCRARVTEWIQMGPHILVRAEVLPEETDTGPEAGTVIREAMAELRALERQKGIPEAVFTDVERQKLADSGRFADVVTPYLPISVAAQQQVLETIPPRERVRKLLEVLK